METATHPLQHLVGTRVPGGEYRVEGYESWLARDALSAAASPQPHPIMAFIGVQRGMGLSVAGLFELLESDIADGPMLAQSTIELDRDLETGRTYAVEGEVVALVRKQGAVLGTFDLATCRFDLLDAEDGGRVASITNVYAIGRDDS